ncbi:hypothetical protein M758_4G129500 [Ceratodon purpureus]|nr:hypothetical protein M758_4G129500 [Ceratodon purpureus]
MAMGLGAMQLLPVGRQRVLASIPHERSVARRGSVTGKIVNGESLRQSGQRRLSLVATSSVRGESPTGRSRRSGVVSCSESSVFDTASETAHEVIDSAMSPTSPVVNSFTEAGIEVVRSIEEAENEVLKAVSAIDQGESIGLDSPIIPTLDALSTEELVINGQTQLLTSLDQPSSAVAASVMISEVANVLKTLERDSKESSESDVSKSEEAEAAVEGHDKMMHGLEQLTSSIEPSLMASEMVDSLISHTIPTSEEGSIEEENVLEQGPASVVESKNFFEQLREIVVFAGPALGIWLSGPIMSLIDTAVVGNSSSLELAALGPGTVLCDQFCYIFMFLSVATSNLVATALAQKNREEAAGHLSRLLFVSLACGVGMFFFTYFSATPLMTAFVGAKNAALVPAALPYVQIRAFAWPAVLVGMVAQSASLGMQDSWAPLKVLAIASSVNLFGDILLCTVLGYGIAGAAWATMASQYVAVILMLKCLNDKGYNPLAISIPSWKDLTVMVTLAGPVLLTMLSKVMFYTLITYLATSLGSVTLAGHQVMIGVYSLCTVWGEPLAQTAQSFMPALICGVDRNLQKARDLLKSLMTIGLVVGFTLGCCAISVPWFFPQIFTKDPAIIAQMRSVSVPFLFSLAITPPTLSLEGTLLAGRDMKFLGFSMATCFIGGSIMLLTMHRLGLGLLGSWWTLAAFQWTRFFQAYSRLHSSRSVLNDPILSHGEGSLLKTA